MGIGCDGVGCVIGSGRDGNRLLLVALRSVVVAGDFAAAAAGCRLGSGLDLQARSSRLVADLAVEAVMGSRLVGTCFEGLMVVKDSCRVGIGGC